MMCWCVRFYLCIVIPDTMAALIVFLSAVVLFWCGDSMNVDRILNEIQDIHQRQADKKRQKMQIEY